MQDNEPFIKCNQLQKIFVQDTVNDIRKYLNWKDREMHGESAKVVSFGILEVEKIWFMGGALESRAQPGGKGKIPRNRKGVVEKWCYFRRLYFQ